MWCGRGDSAGRAHELFLGSTKSSQFIIDLVDLIMLLIITIQGHAVDPQTPEHSGVVVSTPECSGVGFFLK